MVERRGVFQKPEEARLYRSHDGRFIAVCVPRAADDPKRRGKKPRWILISAQRIVEMPDLASCRKRVESLTSPKVRTGRVRRRLP